MSQTPQPQGVHLTAENVVSFFHQLYYNVGMNGGTWMQTKWMGLETRKCPLDMWIYQEMLYLLRPQLIIETGTLNGGSALFLCQMCDLLGGGEVITIDVNVPPTAPSHPRLTYLTGSSTDPEIVGRVRERAAGKNPVMVILDSDHSCWHVLEEMRSYHSLVTPGSFMIVEDSNVNGRPVLPQFGQGPTEAMELFFQENQDFEIDRSCEKFLLTFNPGGYLRKRVKSAASASSGA
jgi:cephalosporin hydroxylase